MSTAGLERVALYRRLILPSSLILPIALPKHVRSLTGGQTAESRRLSKGISLPTRLLAFELFPVPCTLRRSPFYSQ